MLNDRGFCGTITHLRHDFVVICLSSDIRSVCRLIDVQSVFDWLMVTLPG